LVDRHLYWECINWHLDLNHLYFNKHPIIALLLPDDARGEMECAMTYSASTSLSYLRVDMIHNTRLGLGCWLPNPEHYHHTEYHSPLFPFEIHDTEAMLGCKPEFGSSGSEGVPAIWGSRQASKSRRQSAVYGENSKNLVLCDFSIRLLKREWNLFFWVAYLFLNLTYRVGSSRPQCYLRLINASIISRRPSCILTSWPLRKPRGFSLRWSKGTRQSPEQSDRTRCLIQLIVQINTLALLIFHLHDQSWYVLQVPSYSEIFSNMTCPCKHY
jgi:hypothetical protein